MLPARWFDMRVTQFLVIFTLTTLHTLLQSHPFSTPLLSTRHSLLQSPLLIPHFTLHRSTHSFSTTLLIHLCILQYCTQSLSSPPLIHSPFFHLSTHLHYPTHEGNYFTGNNLFRNRLTRRDLCGYNLSENHLVG